MSERDELAKKSADYHWPDTKEPTGWKAWAHMNTIDAFCDGWNARDAEVARLQANAEADGFLLGNAEDEIARLRAALEYFANPEMYRTFWVDNEVQRLEMQEPVMTNGIDIANEALKGKVTND